MGSHVIREAPTSYNFLVVVIRFSFLRRSRFGICAGIALVIVIALSCVAFAQKAAASSAGDGPSRILLVLPFDNHTNQPNLEWIREAAAELLTSRFASAGLAPMTRSDRIYALDHLGLPESFQPSRASALKLAQTLDADAIIVGSYSTDGANIVVEGQVIDVPHLRISETLTERGAMSEMITVFDSLAWKLTRQIDPSFNVAEATFVAAGKSIRLDAFEQYIRGTTEPDQAERVRHLQEAVKLSPDFSQAWMALGRQEYQAQQYEQAAEAFAKVGGGSDSLEAAFYRGLSLLFFGRYADAEHAFADVAKTLPLAEVLNDQGVAVSRQGRDGTGQFIQAAADDPNNADYHFNLAVSLKRHGTTSAALNELAQCLKLRPADSEALALQDAWRRPALAQASASNSTVPGVDPLERIVRTFDAAAFRQATQMLDQMDAAKMADLSPREKAQKLAGVGDGYLSRGLLLEAERLYQQSEAADPSFADAHVGMARVRERSGDLGGAREEARTAVASAPSAAAWLVMAEADLAGNHLKEAEDEAQNALRIEPANPSAKTLLEQIRSRAQ